VREAEAGDAPRFLDRLRAGDAPAFEELVMTYQHRVFGVALRMLGSRAEAEEVAQEAFVRAHRALGEFRGDAKLSTWLYAITSRLCLNRLASGERRMTRQGEDALLRLSDAGPRPDAALERRELESALGQFLGREVTVRSVKPVGVVPVMMNPNGLPKPNCCRPVACVTKGVGTRFGLALEALSVAFDHV